MLKKVNILLLFIFVTNILAAQFSISLNNAYNREIEKWDIQNDIGIFTFSRPILTNNLKAFVNIDSLLMFGDYDVKKQHNIFIKKWRYESLVKIDTDNFKLELEPLFDFRYAKDNKQNKMYFTNTRGYKVWGSINNELYFETSYLENQANFPTYLTDYIHSTNVAPGQGQSRRYKDGFDYGIASGSLLYAINPHLNITIGHGKQFIGDGYRSLLLSDNSFNYPYLQFESNFKRWQFTRIMSVLMSDTLPLAPFGARVKRLGGFNVLSIKLIKNFHLSFFEGNIWNFPDKLHSINFDYKYLIPLIYVNSSLPSNNFISVLGIGMKTNLLRSIQLYNQFTSSLTKIQKNNIAIQAGIKYFDIFTIKNFYVQLEYNYAGKIAYESKSKILTYSHYSQPLAHPVGENFKEFIIISNYSLHRWNANLKILNINYGDDNVTRPEKLSQFINSIQYIFPNIGLGPKTISNIKEVNLSYILNPKVRRMLEIGYTMRDASYAGQEFTDHFWHIAFKTAINNVYYDF